MSVALVAVLHASILAFVGVRALAAAGLGAAGAAGLAGGVAILPLLAVRRLAARLPAELDDSWGGRRLTGAAWAALALLSLVQTARLSAFMSDPSRGWGAPIPGQNTRHMCLAAYVRAAELSRARVGNVYRPERYRRHEPLGGAPTIEHLAPHMSDPFQYPPPFLLLPRAAIAATGDFYQIRTIWFALQALLFGGVALLVALRSPPASRRLSVLLLPAVWASLPTLVNFQYGQAHLFVLALAMAAMLAIDRDRSWLGGGLLAAAIWAKLFPGVLFAWLVARRRWRAVGATGAWLAAVGAIAWAVLGNAPFSAFFGYHLSRLRSGSAFAFYLEDPFTIADNQSIQGLPYKLQALGVSVGAAPFAALLRWLYAGSLLALAFVAARRSDRAEPRAWLALLSLGALMSPYAPGSYALVATIWLLSLLAGRATRIRHGALMLAAIWLFVQTSPFFGDLPLLWRYAALALVASMLTQAIAISISIWGSLQRAEAPA